MKAEELIYTDIGKKGCDDIYNTWSELYSKLLDPIKEFFAGYFIYLEEKGSEQIEKWVNVWKDIYDKITEKLNEIGTAIENAWAKWTEFFEGAGKEYFRLNKQGWEDIEEKISNVIDKFTEFKNMWVRGWEEIESGWNDFWSHHKSGADEFASWFGFNTESVDEQSEDIIEEYKDDFGIHSPSKETEEIGKELVNGLAVGIEDETSNKRVNDAIDNTTDSYKEQISDNIDSIADDTSNSLKDALRNKVYKWIDDKNVSSGIKDWMKNRFEDFSSTINFDDLNADGLNGLFDKFTSSFDDIDFNSYTNGTDGLSNSFEKLNENIKKSSDSANLFNEASNNVASSAETLIDAFSEAGDLAADAFRSSIEAQEDELKKTAKAMGESFALAFNAAEEATANPPLEKQNAEAINATVENFEEVKMYANAYKRQLDTDKAALDKAKAKLTQAEKDAEKKKNADGSADVTSQKNLEKAKKEYEEAEARYNATKSKYDSYVEQAKGFKEDYLTAQEKKEFQKNPKSLEEAIENKNREYELLQEALGTGDYSKLPDYIKSVDDLIAAMKATEDELATLTGYQEEIAAQNKDEEISGDIAPKYTEFDKTRVNASRKALREENEKLAQEYKENESLIAYYEKQNDDYSKKEIERLKERNKVIKESQESNRNLYNSSSAKGYKELVGNREQTQYEINAIEEALKNYKSTGKIILPKSVMEKYSGTKNWGELLQTLYVRLAKYDNDIRAVANIGLENAEDRPEKPDYISLAEQVGNLTSNFEDLFLASEMFTQALNEARTAVGDRLAELDREYTLNMGILKGLEGRTDEASVKRRNELEARQKEIDKERADISKNYNMLSAEDLKQKRNESEALDKQIKGYESLLRMGDEEFAKKSGGLDRSQIVDLYDKARADKATVDKELGILNNVMTKGVESGESIETQTANLDINTQQLAMNVGGVDLSNAGDIFSSIPKNEEDINKWASEKTGITPVTTSADASKIVEDATKQAGDEMNTQLQSASSTLAMGSRNLALQVNKDVAEAKESDDILGNLVDSTNKKLDTLMEKINDIYTNGVNYLAAMAEIQNGMDEIADSGIYLDSKTLIGKIAPGLDRTLGGFAFRRA